ncbi:hypothetical protein WR25_12951 [Diploscapter pachys]|uniref:t-SNARE coiled-coil homology domain-containing protein n=1 Tax=Diploscapter pachys TaxID=2018661 RepID=A0A2A2K309_9BILA|nr:hypothetical protein WR25_12951 [Diploscapter pachys]
MSTAAINRSREPHVGISRNLTEVFMLLRSNAFQNKFVYDNSRAAVSTSSRLSEERMSLVNLESGTDHPADSSVGQPIWIHTCDEIEFEFGRIRSRLDELDAAQQKHISRPNFGDEAFEAEEKRMEQMTEQITSMLSHCQRLINMMSSQISRGENESERRLRENSVQAMINTLGQLTGGFRSRQSKYLDDIKKRSRNIDSFVLTTGGSDEMSWGELVDVGETSQGEYTMDQLQMIMSNEKEVREREKEIMVVNSSIRELNSIFKEVSSMVVEQGALLDRIDYNVEQVTVRVTKATESVHKAERSQRSNWKMKIICCQSVTVIFLLLLILATKFK